jgi:hypothetical protein
MLPAGVEKINLKASRNMHPSEKHKDKHENLDKSSRHVRIENLFHVKSQAPEKPRQSHES